MVTIKSEYVVMCDVDDTLVMHVKGDTYSAMSEQVAVQDPIEPRSIILRANLPMIRLLKEEHARGAYIVVWSKGGHQWARNVVEALGLQKHVALIMSKPVSYLDDKDVSEWMKNRVYLTPDTVYKK